MDHGTTAHKLLERLDGLRAHGANRWMAKCPAHADRSPSLSIRETHDGVVLIHCFAGCNPGDVLAAIGLRVRDLFPEKINIDGLKPQKPNHYHAARDALKMLKHECLVVAITAEDCAKGLPITPEDAERVAQAATRIRNAAEAVA